ncbi:MAG: lipid A biosynthesis lauroyl acyltransferase [Pseudomonadota bacterium]
MTVKQFRQRIEATAARALFALMGALPVDAASGLAGGLLRLVGPRFKVSRVARRNLAHAFPDKSPAEIEAIVAEVWENLGRVAGEFPHIDWLIRNRVEVVGIENLHAMRDDGQPGLFVSAHLGNWELSGAVACHEGLPITLVYRAANNPWIEDIYRKGRGPSATGGQIRKGADGAREIMQVLKAGGHVGMLVDQKMNDGIAVPFFGRDAMTAPAVGRFAVKFGCPVMPARVERLGGARFRMTFYPPLEHTVSGDTHADTLELMTRVNALIESWIRERPGQWLWLHRRWPD